MIMNGWFVMIGASFLGLAVLVLLAVAFFWSADIGLAHHDTRCRRIAHQRRRLDRQRPRQKMRLVRGRHVADVGFRSATNGNASGPDANGQRVLGADEIGKLVAKLGQRGHDAAARFMLWTGCRLEEAGGATWGEIDFERGSWTIPSSRRKDTRSRTRKKQVQQPDHVVYLPRQAIELLKNLGTGETDGLIFQGDRGAKLQNWDRWSKAIISGTGVKDWDRHALRRTTATMAGELGAPPHVISALLGHKNIGDQLTAGYSKARYAAEVGEILQLVADRLEAIENGQDNIIMMRRPA